MSDLISRKALLARVVEANPMGGMIGGKFIEDLIKQEATAYDVDKVVENLELHKLNPYFAAFERKRVDEAIEIVEGGGVDEN